MSSAPTRSRRLRANSVSHGNRVGFVRLGQQFDSRRPARVAREVQFQIDRTLRHAQTTRGKSPDHISHFDRPERLAACQTSGGDVERRGGAVLVQEARGGKVVGIAVIERDDDGVLREVDVVRRSLATASSRPEDAIGARQVLDVAFEIRGRHADRCVRVVVASRFAYSVVAENRQSAARQKRSQRRIPAEVEKRALGQRGGSRTQTAWHRAGGVLIGAGRHGCTPGAAGWARSKRCQSTDWRPNNPRTKPTAAAVCTRQK